LIAESTNQCRSRCSNSYAASATAKPAVTCKSMIDKKILKVAAAQ